MTQRLRVAIVGCGGISTAHMEALAQIPTVTVVAAADVDAQRLQRFCEQWGVSAGYTDYRALLAHERPDLLGICTWEHTHCEITLAAAESGTRGILCEKPMALNLHEADLMIQACDNAQAVLAIGHMRRYNRHYRKLKELIDSGELGQIMHIRAYCGGWDIFLWGTHYADMLYFLNNDQPVEWVAGQISWQHRGMAYPYSEVYRQRMGELFVAEDDAIGYMRFANGVRAILETGVHSPKDWQARGTLGGECTVTVCGTRGAAIADDGNIRYCTGASSDWVSGAAPADEEERAAHWRQQFISEWQDLVAAVQSGREHPLQARRGRAALEMIMAIYESSRRRAVVELPLAVQDNPFLSMVQQGLI